MVKVQIMEFCGGTKYRLKSCLLRKEIVVGCRRIEIPFDTNDNIYLLVWKSHTLRTVSKYVITKIEVNVKDNKKSIRITVKSDTTLDIFYLDDIGSTVFLNREDAVKRLIADLTDADDYTIKY